MKLTKEEVKFIDNYLKSSGIVYEDIRFEMTDHIATALEEQEGDFYENFRLYMVLNKRELLQSDHSFRKAATGRAFRTLFRNMVKPLPLLLPLLFVAVLYAIIDVVGAHVVERATEIAYSIFVLWVVLQYVYNYFVSHTRYSVADRLLTVSSMSLYWIVFFLKPFKVSGGSLVFCIILSFLFFTMGMIYYTYLSLIKKYRASYN